MTDNQTPPDWVLIEAAERSGWVNKDIHHLTQTYHAGNYLVFTALCDMIAKCEQPPVDRKLLCAREAMAEGSSLPESKGAYRRGFWDHAGALKQCLRAIELWEEGFGK